MAAWPLNGFFSYVYDQIWLQLDTFVPHLVFLAQLVSLAEVMKSLGVRRPSVRPSVRRPSVVRDIDFLSHRCSNHHEIWA